MERERIEKSIQNWAKIKQTKQKAGTTDEE